MRNFILEAFVRLTECTTKYEFATEVKQSVTKVFGVSSSQFLFVENGRFIIHKSDKEYNLFIHFFLNML